MPVINIDGVDHDTATFTEAARQQLQSLQFVDAELARLAAQTAVLQTARIAYGNALKAALQPATAPLPQQEAPASILAGDTIKFS